MIRSDSRVPLENHTIKTATGDLVYWTEWELDPAEAAEAIGIYYGAAVLRDHRGYLPVNPFARIPQSQWKRIEEIGLRIWQQGTEKVIVAMLE